MARKPKKSYVADCAIALMDVIPGCTGREKFISGMEKHGWSVLWEDKHKHIVFRNENGDKVRDSNIEKTFAGMKVNKEALTDEFTRQNELRLSEQRAEAELRQYYDELKSAAVGIDNSKAGGNDTDAGSRDTGTLLREVRTDISNSRAQSRTVIRPGYKSLIEDKKRSLEEQRRTSLQERTGKTDRKPRRRKDQSL